WLFAEGVGGGDANFSWQTFLLLANPGATDAETTVTFFRDQGGPVTKTARVRARRRLTLSLSDLRFLPNNVAELANASFSIRVARDQPLPAARASSLTHPGVN